MNWIILAVLVLGCLTATPALASQEKFLDWTSAVIQCGRTPEAGKISCNIKCNGKEWKRFGIHAFKKTFSLSKADLAKLKGFLPSSLQTTDDPGYPQLGGYTIHFRFERTVYADAGTKPATQVICVSVNKKGLEVSDPAAEEHHERP